MKGVKDEQRIGKRIGGREGRERNQRDEAEGREGEEGGMERGKGRERERKKEDMKVIYLRRNDFDVKEWMGKL